MVTIKKRVPGLSEVMLAKFLARARHAARLPGKVSVLVTGSRELQNLNRKFRGKDKATDVLSFPSLPEAADGLAGDIAISADIAASNAGRLGHDPAVEVKILLLHAVLHLAGYDHEHDHGEMARKEQQLRKALGLPLGLIERTADRNSCLPRRLR